MGHMDHFHHIFMPFFFLKGTCISVNDDRIICFGQVNYSFKHVLILLWIRTWASKIGSCISADPFNVNREFDSLCREKQIIKGLCCLHTTFVSGDPLFVILFFLIFLDPWSQKQCSISMLM